jgi:hypothetical protein
LLRLQRAKTQSNSSRDSSPKTSQSEWRLWLELGLAIGITALLRQVFLLYLPFLYAWLWWAVLRRQPDGRASLLSQSASLLRGSLLSITIVLLLILPWSVRNYRVFDMFVPLNTNSGYAFFWGNHPIYGTKFTGILPSDGPSYYELIPPELLSLNEAELDRALLKQGLRFVFDDPVRYFLLSASRMSEYFKFWPSSESGIASNIARVGSFGVVLPFTLYGVWVATTLAWRSRNRYQQAAIILLFSFCLIYTAIHLLTWALIRYRLPVDAVLLIFAAVGMAALASRFGRWRPLLANHSGDLSEL